MREWTSKEIKELKEYFISGRSLKDMSALLGRSITAINKSLTRFEIRQYKPRGVRPLPKYKPVERIQWHRTIECNMDEVYHFVNKCMVGRLKFKEEKWIYHGVAIPQRRAFVLINMEREMRKFPPFYFDYGQTSY